MEDILKKIYYSPETGFTGAYKLWRLAKKENKKISKKFVQKWLGKQEVYQTSKKNSGKLGSFIPYYPLHEFQIDLIYLDNKHLNKASYGLVAIDAFSKKATIKLIKKKNAEEVVKAMREVLGTLGKPEMVYADEGSEFNNEEFKKLMEENNIELVLTLRHATIAERFNRTIKELLYKYLQSTNSKTITNVLPKILNNYNNSYHKTIGMAPNEVTEENVDQVYENILKKSVIKFREKIVPGDRVRVMLKKKSFEKGYQPKFSKEIYKVKAIEGKYYVIDGLQRKYLRAFIEKVGEVEKNPIPADLVGTLEGRLKDQSLRPVINNEKKEKLEKEREEQSIAKTKKPRQVKSKYQSLPAPPPKVDQRITALVDTLPPQSESQKINNLISNFFF